LSAHIVFSHKLLIHRSSPYNERSRRTKQFHKEKHVGKHLDAPLSTQNTNDFTYQQNSFSGAVSQQDRQQIYNASIPQPPHYRPSSQECYGTFVPSVSSMNPGTFQSRQVEFGHPFSVPALNTIPSPVHYPPINDPSQVLAPYNTVSHPPGIPLQPMTNYSSSTAPPLLPCTQSCPPEVIPHPQLPVVSQIQHNNYSYT